MFTAKSQVDDRIEGLESGADAYLTKPTQPRELFAQVKAILKRTPKREVVVQAPAPPPPSGKIFGVLAAKGGIGVSTMATNLAVTLHKKTKENVILSDFRPGQGTIGLDLGFRNPSGMLGLLENNKAVSLEDVRGNLLPHKSGVMTFLSSHEPEDAKHFGEADKFLTITKHLR
ncbi:MAG: Phosphate regulon transcriptional regulatory protein PhoB [Chloroflexi bacterium]|nr:Phosphate regulon transcriptional regulatory protein PhoB [Chloroflexota bacterium]